MLWYPSLPAGMHCGNFTTDQTVPPAVSLSGYQGISGICLKSVITDGSLNDRYNRRQSTTSITSHHQTNPPSWKEIISSCSLHWTSHRVSEGRCSLSTPLARLQTVWQGGEGGEKSRFVKAAPQQTAGNAIGGKLTIWFADKVLFWVLHLANSYQPKLHQNQEIL